MFNETSYMGNFGEYVKGGDTIYYAATVQMPDRGIGGAIVGVTTGFSTSITNYANNVAAGIRSNGFQILNQEVAGNNSIAFNVKAPGDFSDLNDVKALFDGIVQSSGLQLTGSHVEHHALNLASPGTLDPTLGKSIFQVAGEWWTQAAKEAAGGLGQGIADQFGIPKEILIAGAVILGAVLVSSLLRR